ncbi:hypothetical protein ACQP2U_24820 [Nocardia sp. CA-084685]|uniref:hypothetical protein n=1 Tax=Nocardia sp. CA-084685 TaxID=3239970 RepID=UPI003D99DC3C
MTAARSSGVCFQQEHRDLEVYEAVIRPMRSVDVLKPECPRDGQFDEMDRAPAPYQLAVRVDELAAPQWIWQCWIVRRNNRVIVPVGDPVSWIG